MRARSPASIVSLPVIRGRIPAKGGKGHEEVPDPPGGPRHRDRHRVGGQEPPGVAGVRLRRVADPRLADGPRRSAGAVSFTPPDYNRPAEGGGGMPAKHAAGNQGTEGDPPD